ncbi:MAG: sel1 repeat family protein, partial [Akkermansiaceae bacterium]|nr:sel1 repeat family protein [Akkermansiaceae bacterium]
GNAEAKYKLGECYAKGEGVKKDKKEAERWRRKALAQEIAAAERGDAEAQRRLSNRYASGEGVEKDMKEAVRWWRKLAEQGDAGACIDLGECYAEGEGVEKSAQEARRWLLKVLERGRESGVIDENGCVWFRGEHQVSLTDYAPWNDAAAVRDEEECARWFRALRKLAKNKSAPFARYELGCCYAAGRGVKQNWKEAVRWWRNGETAIRGAHGAGIRRVAQKALRKWAPGRE